MKALCLSVLFVAVGVTSAGALAQDRANGAKAEPARPVNAMCPIGKEPIVPAAGTVEYKGQTIGICCPSCGKNFLAWEGGRKDEFVRLAMLREEPGHEQYATKPVNAAEPETAGASDDDVIAAQLMHYPINTCIVAGGMLGSMGAPVNLVHEGRLVRFCCAGCEPKFKEDPQKFLGALDEMTAAQQRDAYPFEKCMVMGDALDAMGEPVDYIHENRLVRLCCEGCIDEFKKDPDAFMDQLDKAYADAQRDDYPLNTCVVGGNELGSMGEPVEIVARAQLVRFCCAGCVPAFEKSPQEFLAKISKE